MGHRSRLRPVVVDVHERGAVAGLRGLGASGLGPAAVGRRWVDAGLWSRHTAARAVVPKGSRGDSGLAGALVALADADGGRVAPYPATEAGIDEVVAAARIDPTVVPPFPLDALARVRHKSMVNTLAADNGLGAPGTMLGTASELRRARVHTPCAVKSDRPIGSLPTTRVSDTSAAVHALLESLPPDEPVLIQPRLRGPLTCLMLVVDRSGRVVSGFQHVASTTWPTAAGSTARGRSIPLDADLVARAGDLLVCAGYWGLAAMDFLEGPRGPVLIDINPRYYTSLALALACGVNLPAAWHSITADTEPPPARPYRTGVTYRWLEAEVLEFGHGLPGRIHDRANRPRTGPMWDPRDPVPGPLLAARAVASAYRRAANRVGVSFRRR